MYIKLEFDSRALQFMRDFAAKYGIKLWEYELATTSGNVRLFQPIIGNTGPTKEMVEDLAERAQSEIKIRGLKKNIVCEHNKQTEPQSDLREFSN